MYHTLLGFLLAALTCMANDGAFIANSGILKPQKQTKIRIQREWLHFDLNTDSAEVSVRFHFFNPDDTVVTLDVGFLVDRGCGDVGPETISKPGVKGLITQLNGEILPYRLYIQSCDTCPLEQPEVAIERENRENDEPNTQACNTRFVFLSKMAFVPGRNVVTHVYSQRPSSSVAFEAEYEYVISTASAWAGGQIDTFECNVRMPNNKLCYVGGMNNVGQVRTIGTAREFRSLGIHPYFADNSKTINDSIISDVDRKLLTRRVFRTVDGVIRFEASPFRPEIGLDVSFTINSILPIRMGFYDQHRVFPTEVKDLASATDSDLLKYAQTVKNTLYAIHGLTFSNKKIQNYFNDQDWYIGDPNLSLNDIRLDEFEIEILESLDREMKSRELR